MTVPAPRVVFMGMHGAFSLPPLRALLDGGFDVGAVVIPSGGPARPPADAQPSSDSGPPADLLSLPMLPSPVHPNVESLARSHGIAVLPVGRLSAPETLAALADFRPEVICVACFPQLLPRALLDLPPLGCLNLHPSLLPAYRGPAPLFWQFRSGEARTGVTLHFMDEGADTGDIAFQREVPFPDGMGGAEADRLCAEAGAELLSRALRRLAQGKCPRRRQPADGASYHPWPRESDFTVPVSWTARRAFNFMCGVSHWDCGFEVVAGRARLRVRRASGYSADQWLGQDWIERGKMLHIQFSPGVLHAER